MRYWQFTAITERGRVIDGALAAADGPHAVLELMRLGLTVVTVTSTDREAYDRQAPVTEKLLSAYRLRAKLIGDRRARIDGRIAAERRLRRLRLALVLLVLLVLLSAAVLVGYLLGYLPGGLPVDNVG